MGWEARLLLGLRVLVVLVGLAVVGLGAWARIIIHDIDGRGSVVLDTTDLQPQSTEDAWQTYFDAVTSSQMRIWVSIAASSFASLAAILILLSHTLDRLRMSTYMLLPLEFLSMLAMAAAFGATLSFAIRLESVRTPSPDDPPSSSLMPFSMLLPLSKGYAIAAGTGGFLLLITSLSTIIQTCHRARNSKACSFEPTASALGMGHGYQAVAPPVPRSTIPTLYDPLKPAPERMVGDEEKGFASAGADMGRGSLSKEMSAGGEEGLISGPLGLQKPERVAQMRPARPWSEMPKR